MPRPKYSYALSLTPFALVPWAAKDHPGRNRWRHLTEPRSAGGNASLFIDTTRRPLR